MRHLETQEHPFRAGLMAPRDTQYSSPWLPDAWASSIRRSYVLSLAPPKARSPLPPSRRAEFGNLPRNRTMDPDHAGIASAHARPPSVRASGLNRGSNRPHQRRRRRPQVPGRM